MAMFAGDARSCAYFRGVDRHRQPGGDPRWARRRTRHSPRFHTVSILAGGAVPPLVIPGTSGTPEASPAAGPPNLIINPAVAYPTGGTAVDGSAPVSSGVPLDPTAPPVVFSFPKEGTFDYLCLVHAKMMKGKVTVQARPK
jgi:hypothetical protein